MCIYSVLVSIALSSCMCSSTGLRRTCRCLQVTDVYGLLNDGSLVIRRAAAALVAGLLEARGRSTLPAQVGCVTCIGARLHIA